MIHFIKNILASNYFEFDFDIDFDKFGYII